MNRRRLLGATTGLLSPFAGCVGDDDPASEEPADDAAGDESSPDTDENVTDEPANEYDPTQRVDPLYVHNLTDRAVTVDVEVVRDGTDEPLLRETYRVPAGHGASVPDVFEVGEPYTVRAEFEGTEQETTIEPPSCETVGRDASPADATPVDVTIWTDESDETTLAVASNSCDEDPTRTELEYEHHSAYAVNESSGAQGQ